MILGQDVGRILMYSEAVDMRKGFEGLIAQVLNLGEDPLSGTLYVFANRRKTYLKALLWHRTGYVLLCKKLERGRFYFQESDSFQDHDWRRFALVLDGIKLGGR